jgi:hypothetical protein
MQVSILPDRIGLNFLKSNCSQIENILIVMLIALILQSCATKQPLTFEAGAGMSSIQGSESYSTGGGGHAAVQIQTIEVNDNSSVNAGVGASLQGSSYDGMYMSGSVKLAYLNVPLLYSYKTNNGIYGEIGLQPGLLLSAKDKYNGESHDFKDQVKKFELGLPVGIGYQFKNGIGIGAKGTYGLTNLDNTGYGKDHNLLIEAVVRYRMDWPKK